MSGLRYNGFMEKEIRQPIQKRSIEKKERIIKAAYELFSENGYYGTVIPMIAARAGVSTGIVYGYFTDKRDILFYVLKIYVKETSAPIIDYIGSLPAGLSVSDILKNLIELTEQTHRNNEQLHNILHSLAFTEDDINEEFLNLESHLTMVASKKLRDLGYGQPNLEEIVHIAMNVIQAYAHETIYDKHDYINYDIMKAEIIRMLEKLFN